MRQNTILRLLVAILGICILQSCDKQAHTYHIGVSQCASCEWRDMQNEEMLVESTFYEQVKLSFKCAEDDDSTQIADIENLIDQKVDLLVISPNTKDAITPIISKAYKAGIPVVLFDRRIDSDDFTAFVGASNFHIGEQAGHYLAEQLKGKGIVYELLYNQKSAPFSERHKGFQQALKSYPNIENCCLNIGKSDEMTFRMFDSLFTVRDDIDAVLSQIDNGCEPVYEALKKHGLENKVLNIGIDGMPFKDAGIDKVLTGKQSATFTYPAGGDRIIQVAMQILQHQPYSKETELPSFLVDKKNVHSSRMQQDLVLAQNKKINRLYAQSDKYLTQIAKGKLFLFGILIIVLLLCIIVFVLYHAYRIRKRFNQQLKETTQAKLAFFTNVSHDFRTPLTLISGPLAQLKEHSKWKAPELQLYDIIQKNVDILLRLVNQLIDFRKYENGMMELNLTTQNIGTLINEWSRAFYGLAQEKHITFEVTVDEQQDIPIELDEEKMERVFYNVVYNAFKFTSSGGTIRVEQKYIGRDEQLASIRISDTGIGMSPQHLKMVFDRFYKVDSHDTGSGIGLNLSKAFVELHGGTIQVQSEEGKGTTFSIEIPIHKVAQTSASTPEAKEAAYKETPFKLINESSLINELEQEIHNQNDTTTLDNDTNTLDNEENTNKNLILIVDDNADIREYMSYLFKDHYRVLKASNGQQGLEMALRYVPDAIICDVMMPVMNGMELCSKIKENMFTSHIPVLMLTACTLDKQRVSGYQSGADSYISKPFSAELLLSRVQNLIANRKRIKSNHISLKVPTSEVKDLDELFIRKFHKLVEENLSDSDLSMDWLGEQLAMSRVQLYRKVKALFGTTPSELIRDKRMNKAHELLQVNGATVTSVAYEVGFSSASYFSKCYKEYFGEVPTASKH